MNIHEVNRVVGALSTLGARRFMGTEETDIKLQADGGGAKASNNPRKMPHYTAIMHPLVTQDMRENSTVVTAWSYSDVNRIYNYELGELSGVRFCESNLVPSWTGYTNSANGVTYTPGSSGSLATNSYYVIVTGSDINTQYESQVYAVSGAQAVTGPNGSISVKLPSITGYTYNVYIGTTTSPANLALSPSGPTTGPLQGQATQLAPSATVTITGTGTTQVPPAAPASGLTVYPTYFFGKEAYGQVVLDEVKTTYLQGADKSDPLNQLRVVGWKVFYGTLIENQLFFCRTEATSNFSTTFG
jgi:hypothetical protein